MNHRLAAVAATVGLTTLLTACGQVVAPSDTPAPTPPATGTNRPGDFGVTSTQTATPSPTSTTQADKIAKFGESFTWTDGVQVTVKAPTDYKPSRPEYAKKAPHFVKMEFVVVNTGKEAYDPAIFHVTVQSDNTEADQLFDSGGGMKGAPNTKILPGRESKFFLAFGVDNPKDLVVEVSPGFKYKDAIWTS